MIRFKSLRTRLTLTYVLVTVGALLALLIVLLSGVFVLSTISGTFDASYLADVEQVLNSRAVDFAKDGDIEGLQHWMDRRYSAGNASESPADLFDNPLARFAPASDFYFIDSDKTVLAQSPKRDAVGQMLPLPASAPTDWLTDLPESLSYSLDYRHILPDGNWFYLFAVWDSSGEYGAIALTVEPAPPFYRSKLSLFGAIVAGAALALLLGVAPFGALFGYLMARNLTRRLGRLETAAEAYSRGEFDVVPDEQSGDEIGRLAHRLTDMTQQIKTLLQSRQELMLVEERNRLARDLHDTVKQQNFATLMQIRAAKNLARQGRDHEIALGHLESAESLLKQSQQDLKDVIEELRPAQLDGHGLPAALRQFAAEWSQQNGIVVDVALTGESPLPLTTQQALYRVAQEAFANIARHSEADHVTVRLQYQHNRVILAISDNGRGFDTAAQAGSPGFGLSTMQQRITEANGTLVISGEVGQGTTVTVDIAV